MLFYSYMDSLEWDAFEYNHRKRSIDWYWGLAVGALAISILSVLLGNSIFAILILIIALVVGLHSREQPPLLHFEINNRGIIANKRLYPYESLESFWVEDREARGVKVLVKSKKLLVPLIVMPVESSIIPDTIRAYLREHMHEEEHAESIFHYLMEYLGF